MSNGRQSPGGHELEDCSDATVPSHLKTVPDKGGEGGHRTATSSTALIAIPPPWAPLKSVLHAYLPNEQKIIVQVKPGQ